MKYRSYQPGGVIYTPFIPTNGAATQTTGSSTSSTKASTTPEKISGTMTKEIIDILKSNGIPSDVDAFLTTANSFLVKSQSLSNMSLFGGTDDDYDLSDLITIQKMANDVRFNNEQYNKAVANLDKEDAWSDVALDQRGFMWVQDKDGELKTVHATKFNPEEQYALTNEELLSLRERSSEFAMNRTVLNSMTGTVGVKTVQDYLVGLIEKLGTDIQQGYASKKEQDIFTGAQLLMKNGPDGFYKITDKQQARSLTEAVNYLTNQLVRNKGMLNVIQATIAANGGDPSKDMASMIAQMVQNHVDIELKADFDSAATKSAGLDAESRGSTKTEKLSRLAAFAAGKGEREQIFIVPRASEVGQRGTMVASAMNFGNMIGFDDNTLPAMSVGSLRSKAEYFKAAFNQDVTFGGQLLKGMEENAVLWDGTSQVAQVWLPYKRENGQITPDFDLFMRYMDFVSELDQNPNLTALEKNKLLNKYRLVGELDQNTLQLKNTMCFMTFSGYAHEDNIKFTDTTKRMTEKVSREEGSRIAQIYENASRFGDVTPTKKSKNLYGFDKINSWDKNDFRKGNIFIPIKSSFLGTYASMNEIIPESMVNNFNVRSQLANGRPVINGQFNEYGY